MTKSRKQSDLQTSRNIHRSGNEGGMSTGSKILALVGIVSLSAFLLSSLVAIWSHDATAQKDFMDVIRLLLSWPVIAGGLAGAGAIKFGPPIVRRLQGRAHDPLGDVMKFTLSHARSTVGNDLSVLVVGEGDAPLSRVKVDYDGFGLSDEMLGPGVTQYEKHYSRVGTAAPGEPHKLVVAASSRSGDQRTAMDAWQDSM